MRKKVECMNSHHHHKHIHPGRPSSIFFSPEQVLNKLEIREGHTLLDAGCGDGFISIAASKLVGESGLVFAIDQDEQSIEQLKREIELKEIMNIRSIKADIAKSIPIDDNSIDICFMVNVFHGIVENEEVESALAEIKRVVKTDGDFAVVDFKKMETFPGPPISIRLEPHQLESILMKYDFEKRNYFEVGQYHYAAVFGNL
jgi:ubiquinone/menaquinone biosynthesis C-methylase UbiE